MIKKIVHFFGFRGDEYNRAKKIWGEPDFIHPVHDRRSYIYPNYEREDLGDDNNANEEAKKQINDAFKTILDNLPK